MRRLEMLFHYEKLASVAEIFVNSAIGFTNIIT